MPPWGYPGYPGAPTWRWCRDRDGAARRPIPIAVPVPDRGPGACRLHRAALPGAAMTDRTGFRRATALPAGPHPQVTEVILGGYRKGMPTPMAATLFFSVS